MRLTNKHLKHIIEEEVALLEVGLQELPGDSLANKLESVKAGIAKGDAANKAIAVDMANKAKRDFIEIFERQMIKKIKEVVARNPDVKYFSDLSVEIQSEIRGSVIDASVAEYKATYTETVLLREYVLRLEKKLGIRPIPPTLGEFLARYVSDFVYQFVFGWIDNFVMVRAGASLESALKARYAKKGLTGNELELTVGAIGNTISDGVGDVGAGYTERMLEDPTSLGGLVGALQEKAATDRQMEVAPPLWKAILSSATLTGVMAGCIMGWKMALWIGRGMTTGLVGTTMRHPVTIIAGLIGAGVLGVRWKMTYDTIQKLGQTALNNALKRLVIGMLKLRNEGLYPQDRLQLHEYIPEDDNQYGGMFKQDIIDNTDYAQKIWNSEMDVDVLGKMESGMTDAKPAMRSVIANWSEALGLQDPNVTTLEETRWSRLAGIKG
jgi:hypothetical protein